MLTSNPGAASSEVPAFSIACTVMGYPHFTVARFPIACGGSFLAANKSGKNGSMIESSFRYKYVSNTPAATEVGRINSNSNQDSSSHFEFECRRRTSALGEFDRAAVSVAFADRLITKCMEHKIRI